MIALIQIQTWTHVQRCCCWALLVFDAFDTKFQRKWNEKCAAHFDRQVLTICIHFWWIRLLPWSLRYFLVNEASWRGENSCQVVRNCHGLRIIKRTEVTFSLLLWTRINQNLSVKFRLYHSHWQVQRPSINKDRKLSSAPTKFRFHIIKLIFSHKFRWNFLSWSLQNQPLTYLLHTNNQFHNKQVHFWIHYVRFCTFCGDLRIFSSE